MKIIPDFLDMINFMTTTMEAELIETLPAPHPGACVFRLPSGLVVVLKYGLPNYPPEAGENKQVVQTAIWFQGECREIHDIWKTYDEMPTDDEIKAFIFEKSVELLFRHSSS